MDAAKHTLKKPAIASAVASVEAEGFVVDEVTLGRLERFESGEISAEELRRQTLHDARAGAGES